MNFRVFNNETNEIAYDPERAGVALYFADESEAARAVEALNAQSGRDEFAYEPIDEPPPCRSCNGLGYLRTPARPSGLRRLCRDCRGTGDGRPL